MYNKTIIMLNCHDDDVYCFRKELIESFANDGYTVVLSCPYGEKLELVKGPSTVLEDVSIDRRGTNPFHDLKLLHYYLKLYKKYRPCAVFAFTIKPNIYGGIAARMLHIPYLNNITGLGSGFDRKGIVKSMIIFLYKIALKKSSMVFFQNSENMKVALKLGMVSGLYQLIPGSGVNTERFPLQPYPDGGNGKSGETVVFNYIGRVLHDKGVDDYIAAAKIIKAKYPKTEFNIIGFVEPREIHYQKELEELEKQDIVIYRGQQTDVLPFLARAHSTLHPSMYGEGISNVLLESASSGRVLITTANPGCRETVDDNVTGFIYAGGIENLIDKIEVFLSLDNETRKNMGVHGREKVVREFSREFVIEAYRMQMDLP